MSIPKLTKTTWPVWLIAAIFIILPFHAVLTTWAGSNFGHLDLFRLWPQFLLLPLGLTAIWRLFKQPALRHQLQSSALVWLVAVYSLIMLGYGLIAINMNHVNWSALLFSWVTNLSFLWFMLLVWLVAIDDHWLQRRWWLLVLGPAGGVVLFGLLQQFVLPADVLRHVGYGSDTIPAVQTVDQKLDYRRLQSTLRGANPLGAYLVIIMVALAAGLYRRRWQIGAFGGLVLAGVVLFFSYSRSAWLGVIISGGLLIWWHLPSWRWRQLTLLSAMVLGVIGLTTVWSLRHNDVVQNTLFHADEHSLSATSSNQGRSQAWRNGLIDLVIEPLGRGPGTAGPASARNQQPARISENYFLQIGQEIGWPGLILFVAINVSLAKYLWQRRQLALAQILLVSLAGLTVINLLSHAWTDPTLGLLYWGLAGVALGQPAKQVSRT